MTGKSRRFITVYEDLDLFDLSKIQTQCIDDRPEHEAFPLGVREIG